MSRTVFIILGVSLITIELSVLFSFLYFTQQSNVNTNPDFKTMFKIPSKKVSAPSQSGSPESLTPTSSKSQSEHPQEIIETSIDFTPIDHHPVPPPEVVSKPQKIPEINVNSSPSEILTSPQPHFEELSTSKPSPEVTSSTPSTTDIGSYLDEVFADLQNNRSKKVPFIKPPNPASNATCWTPTASEVDLTPTEILSMQQKILRQNSLQPISNLGKFGLINNSTVVIVVQTHVRMDSVKILLQNLRHLVGVENVFLIFSMDVWNADVHECLTSIDFVRVLVIYFPDSLQLHPKQFPGREENDCTNPATKATTKGFGNVTKTNETVDPKSTCVGNKDSYGNYRNGNNSQIKHHWWWKLNFVFRSIRSLANYPHPILFMEEDQLLAPDSLQLLPEMFNILENGECDDCNILTLSNQVVAESKNTFIPQNFDRLGVETFQIGKHSLGMLFTRAFYNELRYNCTSSFCFYDDYNWDWSLKHVGATCLRQRMRVLYPSIPRTFHFGSCGVHARQNVCDPAVAATKIAERFQSFKGNWFPAEFRPEVEEPRNSSKIYENVPPYGGWADQRDRDLCTSFAQ